MKICKHKDCGLVHYGNGYCRRHNRQWLKHGFTTSRSQRDGNNILRKGEFAYIELYDIKGNVIGVAKIDEKNIDKIKEYKWSMCHGYAATRVNDKYIKLSRMIMGNNDSEIDHIDRVKLNDTEDNLRFCNRSENVWNEGISKNNTSGYKGVSFDSKLKKWVAYITIKRKKNHLGYFANKMLAAMEYNKAAQKAFGNFAYLNTVSAW